MDVDADPVTQLTQLAAEVRSFRRTVRAAIQPDAQHEGWDATGLVRLVADGTGRVRSIDISRDWFAARGPAGLGPAMFEAYQAAITEVLLASLDRMTAAEAEEAARSGAPEPPAPEASVRDGRYSSAAFAGAEAALAELEERDNQRERFPASQSTADTVLYGPYRLVEVTVRNGAVAEIAVTGPVRRDRVDVLADDAVHALRKLHAERPTETDHRRGV